MAHKSSPQNSKEAVVKRYTVMKELRNIHELQAKTFQEETLLQQQQQNMLSNTGLTESHMNNQRSFYLSFLLSFL